MAIDTRCSSQRNLNLLAFLRAERKVYVFSLRAHAERAGKAPMMALCFNVTLNHQVVMLRIAAYSMWFFAQLLLWAFDFSQLC